jgi:hypothetical protein
MCENDNSNHIQPDSGQTYSAPPKAVASGINAANSPTHDEKRQDNTSATDVIPVTKNGEWPMIVLTAIIALSTAANVIVYWRESISAGKQTERLIDVAKAQSKAATDMAQAARDQVDASNNFADSAEEVNGESRRAVDQFARLAKATEQTVTNSQQSFADDRRAWIGYQDAVLDNFEPNKPISFQITFMNTGRTPAREVFSNIGYKLSNAPINGPSANDIADLDGQFTRWPDIAPQAKRVMHIGDLPDSDTIKVFPNQSGNVQTFSDSYVSIKNRTIILYLYGTIRYKDIDNRPHSTKWCVFLLHPERKLVALCPEFNYMD